MHILIKSWPHKLTFQLVFIACQSTRLEVSRFGLSIDHGHNPNHCLLRLIGYHDKIAGLIDKKLDKNVKTYLLPPGVNTCICVRFPASVKAK